MCLLITRTTPWSKSPFRYKILTNIVNYPQESLTSWFMYNRWSNNKLSTPVYLRPTTRLGEKVREGIHTFQTFADAFKCLKCAGDVWNNGTEEQCIVRVRVADFLGAGEHVEFSQDGDGLHGEIWKRARIVKIWKMIDHKKANGLMVVPVE